MTAAVVLLISPTLALKSGSQACWECVLAPYRERTLVDAQPRGWLLLLALLHLSDVFMRIWQCARMCLSTISSNPISRTLSSRRKAAICFDEVCKEPLDSWWNLSISRTTRSSAEEIHRFFHLHQIKITCKRAITWLDTQTLRLKTTRQWKRRTDAKFSAHYKVNWNCGAGGQIIDSGGGERYTWDGCSLKCNFKFYTLFYKI